MMFLFDHDDVIIHPSMMMMGYDATDGKNGLCSKMEVKLLISVLIGK